MSAQQRTHWGFHRLSDEWARRLVRRADIQPGELVLDLGAGDGAVTDHLLRAGARVVAVELHPDRVASLRERYRGAPVRVIHADVTALRLPAQPFSVVANLPFAATTSVLRRLLTDSSRLVRAELIVPKHVAVRWSSGRGTDVDRWHRRFDATFGGHVPPHAFRPAPPSPVAVLTLADRARRKTGIANTRKLMNRDRDRTVRMTTRNQRHEQARWTSQVQRESTHRLAENRGRSKGNEDEHSQAHHHSGQPDDRRRTPRA